MSDRYIFIIRRTKTNANKKQDNIFLIILYLVSNDFHKACGNGSNLSRSPCISLIYGNIRQYTVLGLKVQDFSEIFMSKLTAEYLFSRAV